jgi:hypothetical protein
MHPCKSAEKEGQQPEMSVLNHATVTTTSYQVAPSASRLTGSLRDIGYDVPTAIADLVDNSITADATEIEIAFSYDGPNSSITILDDGNGMTANGVLEALRFGTRKEYEPADLGRFGLGLKTASLSLCRSVTIVSKWSHAKSPQINHRTLDLDIIDEFDDWLVVENPPTPAVHDAITKLESRHGGTAIVLEKLDRVLDPSKPMSGWARRKLLSAAAKTTEHLAIVFHRFLSGDAARGPVTMTVHAEGSSQVEAWDPFACDEASTLALEPQVLEIEHNGKAREVGLRRYILPARSQFSSVEKFESLAGPLKWNRQQGLYIYRANRLVQHGGWNGIRAIDEHTKLARAALDFDTQLDTAFQVNVSKMRVNLPTDIRTMLEQPVHDLCVRASDRYRLAGESGRTETNRRTIGRSSAEIQDVAVALRAAALEAGELPAFERALRVVAERAPEIYRYFDC